MGGKKHRALAGRIAAADQNDLFACAQARLDLRRPVPDPATLEARDVGDRRTPVSCAARDHDRPGLNAIAAVKFEDERAIFARAIQRPDPDGNHHVGAEFLRLNEGAGSQRLAAYPGGKAKVVFDPGAGSGLPAVSAGVENRHRQSFGAGVHGGREPGGPGADHRHVVDEIRPRRDGQPDLT